MTLYGKPWGNETRLYDLQKQLQALGYKVVWVSNCEMSPSLDVWLSEGQKGSEVVSKVKELTGHQLPAWAVRGNLVKVNLPEKVKKEGGGTPFDEDEDQDPPELMF